MDEEEVKKALDAKFKGLEEQLAEAQKNGASKEEVQKLHKAIEKQGTTLQDFIEQQNQRKLQTVEEQFNDFLLENKEEIEAIYKKGSGTIEFKPDFSSKAVDDISTSSGTNAETPNPNQNTNLGNFNLRNDNALLNLMTVTSTNNPNNVSYTELTPKEGSYAIVAEGEEKPQIDFKWENRYPKPKKIAAYEILTEEAATDIPRLQSVGKEYLRKKHDLFKVDRLFFSDGTGENPIGATQYGRTFVAGSMANAFEDGTTTFMDVVNAIVTDIYTTANFADEMPYEANIVLLNPVDFFLQIVGAKDKNGLPLYPQAGLFNQVRIGGVTIKPWIKVPSGKIFVADMTKYNLINYIPFSIRIGWINDQFITNKFTMLGESRFFQYVKNLDQAAFVYDDFATVKAAITAPAA